MCWCSTSEWCQSPDKPPGFRHSKTTPGKQLIYPNNPKPRAGSHQQAHLAFLDTGRLSTVLAMIKLPIHSVLSASLSPDRQQMAIHTADSSVYVADTFYTNVPVNDPYGSRPQSGRSGASTTRQSGTQRELEPMATCREVVRYHKGAITGLVILPDREVRAGAGSDVFPRGHCCCIWAGSQLHAKVPSETFADDVEVKPLLILSCWTVIGEQHEASGGEVCSHCLET